MMSTDASAYTSFISTGINRVSDGIGKNIYI